MLKSLLSYSVLISFIKKYQAKLYLLFSLAVVYFLIDHTYKDVHQYLSEAHPEYLVIALWVKSLSLIALGVALLWSFRPINESTSGNNSNDKTNLSDPDQELINKIASKPNLETEEFDSDNHSNNDSLSTDEIVNNVRSKRKLETQADKIIRQIEQD